MVAVSEPPNIVAAGFATRFVAHATSTATVVATPTAKSKPRWPSAMRTRSSEIDDIAKAPSRPKA